MTTSVRLLIVNGAAQMLGSIVLGFLMLIPFQPWGKRLVGEIRMRDLLSAHLDWIMLSLADFAAAFGMSQLATPHAKTAAVLLVFGGWSNPVPYFLRAFGINGFALAGRPLQVAVSLFGLVSSIALAAGWTLALVDWVF